jgi:hypothetical protein
LACSADEAVEGAKENSGGGRGDEPELSFDAGSDVDEVDEKEEAESQLKEQQEQAEVRFNVSLFQAAPDCATWLDTRFQAVPLQLALECAEGEEAKGRV